MVRLILFDIDGTLIQSGGAGEKAFARVCKMEFGIPNGTVGLSFAGRTDTSIVREFFTRHTIEPIPANFDRFFDHYVFQLDHLLRELHGTVLPGVHHWLEEIASWNRKPGPKPTLGLLTGNILLGARIKLGHFRLWDWFTMGAFGDDHEDRNQLAAIARNRGTALRQEKLTGEQILVIGDTPKDIECAAAIGARCVAVATGHYSVPELRSHQPRWAVKSLRDLSAREACAP